MVCSTGQKDKVFCLVCVPDARRVIFALFLGLDTGQIVKMLILAGA